MRTIIVISSALFAALALAQSTPQAGQQPPLLGISLTDLQARYPKECTDAQAKRDEKKAEALRRRYGVTPEMMAAANQMAAGQTSCDIKHEKELFGVRLDGPIHVILKNGVVIVTEYRLKGADLQSTLTQLYGAPDPAPQLPGSDPQYGSVTYGGTGQSTTLDPQGESHFAIRTWTRPGFKIMWTTSSHMSWSDQVNRDTDPALGDVLYKPSISQSVTFTLKQ